VKVFSKLVSKIQKFRLSENKKKHFFYVERKKFRPKVNKRAIYKIKYDFFAIILFFFMMVAQASQARNLFYPSARFSKLVSHPLLRYLYSRLCHMGQDLPAHDVIESYAALFTAMQGNAPQGPFVLVDVDAPSAEVAHAVYQLLPLLCDLLLMQLGGSGIEQIAYMGQRRSIGGQQFLSEEQLRSFCRRGVDIYLSHLIPACLASLFLALKETFAQGVDVEDLPDGSVIDICE